MLFARALPTPFVLALLAGCATVPDLGTAPVIRAPDTLAATQSLRGPRGDWPAADWWRAYRDPALDALMDEALRTSPDSAAAAARVNAADAIAAQAGAALAPSLGVDGTVGGIKQSENTGVPPQFVPKGVLDNGRVTTTLSFNLDLWGKNRTALAAARGEAAAARVDADQARLMLTTGIASAYADLDRYYAAQTVARDALKARQATLKLTADRVAVGVDTRGSLRQAQSRVPQAQADLDGLDEALALTRHRIAALLGAGPDRGLAIARPMLVIATTGIPAEAGIDLIGRRPDIVAARLRAEAAAARINVAHADFYPNINLSAVVGLQALGLGNLLQSGSTYGSSGVALSLPIFDAGRIAARYAGARADYDAAVARYDATLIAALRDSADALTSRAAAERQLVDLRAALAAAEDASSIAIARYRGGLSNQLQVLVTADALLGLRRTVAELDARRLALDIQLIRALGGGYQQTNRVTGAR
jgi:NodT family efflux transporter outer membrane factor (OMF) lipoprotein